MHGIDRKGETELKEGEGGKVIERKVSQDDDICVGVCNKRTISQSKHSHLTPKKWLMCI